MIYLLKNSEKYYYELQCTIGIFFLREEIKYIDDLNEVRETENAKFAVSLVYIDEVKKYAVSYGLFTDNYEEFKQTVQQNGIAYKNDIIQKYNSIQQNNISREDDIKNKTHSKNYEDTNNYKSKLFIERVKFNDLDKLERNRQLKHIVKKSIFLSLKKSIKKETPWGLLTGIRPTKRVYALLKSGMDEGAVIKVLTEDFFASTEKSKLICDISKIQKSEIDKVTEKSVSLYLNIPFCPTRCVYCSFTSNAISMHGKMIEPYLEAIKKEMEFVGQELSSRGLHVSSIYVGGGTPTSISEDQLYRFFEMLKQNIDYKEGIEFTVEAGRPDTINYKKLQILKSFGVNRVSINPQTMNVETLKTIGRNHSPKDIIEKYYLAKEVGFNSINMDIIVGLPGEDEHMVANTMEELKKLKPDNLTVHTMALKRASALNQKFDEFEVKEGQIIADMMKIPKEYAIIMDLKPYYLYRQKHMVGNLENIGYALEDKVCFYNIVMMEEKENIIALGAGAVSKFIDFTDDRLERVFNVKGLYDYINRIDEMIGRKKKKFHEYYDLKLRCGSESIDE